VTFREIQLNQMETSVILKICLSFCLFHFIILLVLFPMNRVSQAIHDGAWLLKFVLLAVIYALIDGFSMETLSHTVEVLEIFNYVFCMVQVLYVVQGAFRWNDYLTRRSNIEGLNGISVKLSKYLTFFFNFVSILILAFSFTWFLGQSNDEKSLEIFK
jgi:hypothetical protein